MTKAGKLTLRVAQEGDWHRVAFAGPMTEEAKAVLTPLLASAGPKLILDLGEVTYMNSIGIRDWSHFLKALKSNRELAYDRLPDEVVQTMNMITNFHLKVPVRSVFRAYGCEHCGHEQIELFNEGRDFKKGAVPSVPPKTCGGCGKQTTPFSEDDAFFSFLLSA